MWPAALLLGRWLRWHRGLVAGRSVHELGAGLGLSGLVAAMAGASATTLSDFNPEVVKNLGDNIALNDPVDGGGLGGGRLCSAAFLDWADLSAAAPCDLVIASDVVCQTSDAENLARAVGAVMAPGGAALIFLPFPENRFGTEAFPHTLAAQGFAFEAHEVRCPRLKHGIDEANFFRWNAFLITGTAAAAGDSQWHRDLATAVRQLSEAE